ncbi:malonate decarboxylase subunit alpha [uncultured Dialister sp.]|uniref:malonate decarboxylase subunit alpha n=1 Tax=uncultured Dialister sp. TaxID=278064 RepID=UPI0025FEF079|nr:malonate decarboxylase subunit alpha [uncultured Dialister sp.]
MLEIKPCNKNWHTRGDDTAARLNAARVYADGKIVDPANTVKLLEAVLRPGDKVNIEGDNQKQADFLAKELCKVDPSKVHDLHMIQSTLSIPEHLDVFDKGIARKLDFAYAGSQGKRLAQMVQNGGIELGAIHTYLEMYSRYFIDLVPRVSLVCADAADKEGNIYTGFSTEDTPAIVEATKFNQGIVIFQVNKIVDKVPRVDIPSDWVDFVIEAPTPYLLNPLFTRDPAKITNDRIMKAMMAIKGIYAEYGVKVLNHGVGYDTAAVELLLPTFGESLGLKGKICTHWVLNPHPTLIPAIETGWVQAVYSFGSEVGMEEYIKARPDIFAIGPDGTMRSNRAFCQAAGHYAADMFIGSTMQIDRFGNSSTATKNNVAGFGGAPNMGCDAKGRRHVTEAWKKCGEEVANRYELMGDRNRGKKLVVQMITTVSAKGFPGFVDQLDAVALKKNANLDLEPIMIYSDDLTHIVSEVGIACLHKCHNMEERMDAIRAVAGKTDVGKQEDPEVTKRLRKEGIVKLPEDLGINRAEATRDLLAAKNMKDLVDWSGGLYDPPAKFRNW